MYKKDLIRFGAVAIFFTVILLCHLQYQQYLIFPSSKSSGISINTSHEGVKEGYSTIQLSYEKDSSISFSYCLSKQIQEPIVALYFHKLNDTNKYFDLSDFNQISVVLKAQKAKRIPIYFTIEYRKLKSKSKDFLSMPLVHVIDYKGEGIYHIARKDFEIPSWWLRYHGLKREAIGEIDYSKVDYILVNSCQTLSSGVKDTITVKKMYFSYDNTMYYYLYWLAILVLVIVVVGKWVYNKRKKILVPYKINDLISNPNGTKLERILHYIGTHYANPELAVTDIQEALGISTREIGNLIKEELDTNFKTYLNTIRLTEVKRLLQETDLPVSDIAYKTGYNNVSHFNRVFKKEFNLSPSEFRDSLPTS
jgi:AraC-like DNA-binding protein